MRRLSVVYSLIAVYLVSERFLRQGTAATNLEAPQIDQGCTRAIGEALGVNAAGLIVAPFLNRLLVASLPQRRLLFRTGVSAMIGGILLRSWANRVLGGAYTRMLRVVEGQQVIQAGPYRVVRHLGYLGTLLVWLGAALALANGITLTIAGATLLRAYILRMDAEEQMLLDAFGEGYRGYARQTKRLVPHIY
jgi:protein-S-isoprenylcysteine O-methyltransferase